MFNPDGIGDVATYEATNESAVDVQTLLVNGMSVVAEGELVADT